MNKQTLRKVAAAATTEEQARIDPAGAFRIALATARAAFEASKARPEQ